MLLMQNRSFLYELRAYLIYVNMGENIVWSFWIILKIGVLLKSVLGAVAGVAHFITVNTTKSATFIYLLNSLCYLCRTY